MTLLSSTDHGIHFQMKTLNQWATPTCPMSTASLASGVGGVLAATETQGKVCFTAIDPASLKPDDAVYPIEPEPQRHPVVISNAKGEVLLAWTEGTGWGKGEGVKWQVFDRDAKPTAV